MKNACNSGVKLSVAGFSLGVAPKNRLLVRRKPPANTPHAHHREGRWCRCRSTTKRLQTQKSPPEHLKKNLSLLRTFFFALY
ncbi:hypothetical protein U1Q18_034008 [Sarracenia purpurea var. burkii]